MRNHLAASRLDRQSRRAQGDSILNSGSEITGYEEERMLLKRYLSDEIAPMIFSDTADELFAAPPEIIASEIQSWMGDQIRGASNMTAGDLIFHAATKLHQLGVLELLPREDVTDLHRAPAAPYRRDVPRRTPGWARAESPTPRTEQRDQRRQDRGSPQTGRRAGRRLPASAGWSGARAGPRLPGPGSGGVPQTSVDPATVQRLNLLLDRLKQSPAGKFRHNAGGTIRGPWPPRWSKKWPQVQTRQKSSKTNWGF